MIRRVFKFGGSSIKDIDSIKNISNILNSSSESLFIVFSAMGKTTNMLEEVVNSYFSKSGSQMDYLNKVKNYHYLLMSQLFEEDSPIYNMIGNLFLDIELILKTDVSHSYNYYYDQIVSFGEILSTNILSQYLLDKGFQNQWIDARSIIKTDHSYRSAKIDWKSTKKNISDLSCSNSIITQGFIAGTSDNLTTTLGREGSDFTAAIIAYSIDARNLVIWKDVLGVLNADPRFFSEQKILEEIPFNEAIELAYYGAKVIHPRTIQPLQRKNISLIVRSFLDLKSEGSIISDFKETKPRVPFYIVKSDQILISISDQHLSFIVEEHLKDIFALIDKYSLNVNMMQNSAVSFSVCVNNDIYNIPKFILDLRSSFDVYFNKDLSLYTIRYYTEKSIQEVTRGKNVLLEQKSRNTVQIVVS